MSNKTEPLSFIVGQELIWEKRVDNYACKIDGFKIDEFKLLYSFRSSAHMFDVEATAGNDHYLIKIPSSKTMAIKPANYWWQAMLCSSLQDVVHIIAEGQILAKPNLALLEEYDGRSHAQKILEALEDTLLGKASRDQMGYSIAGRSISRLAPAELLKWRDLYKAEYARELKQERLKQGLGVNSNIKVRF